MRKLAAFLWLCAVLVVLYGCGAIQAAEQPAPTPAATATPEPTPVTLRVSVGREGSTIDPAYVPEIDPADYLGHLFEGLMKYAPARQDDVVNVMEIVPGLAEKAEVSDDGLIYRFTLRPDARWSDGQRVLAEDFVYAWQRLLQVGQSPGAEVLRELLNHYYAESDGVLVVELTGPCPYFLKLCAAHYMVPLRRDMIEKYGGDWTAEENIVVSGPYTIRHWVHDDTMTLVPNPYYYDRQSLGPEVIQWRFGTRDDSHVTVGSGGERVPAAGTYFLYLNAHGITDWRVRAAMVLAVDREALGEELDMLPARGLVPEGVALTEGGAYEGGAWALYARLQELYPGYDLSYQDGRRRLARNLMDRARAAGTWNGGYKLYYRVTPGLKHRQAALQCIQDWRQVLGMNIKMVEMEEGAYQRMLESNTFHVAYLSWLPDYDDPMSFLQVMTRGGEYNHSGWGDVRYNQLLGAAQAAGVAGARDELLREAEAFLFREEGFAVCPLLWMQEQYSAEGVTGIGYSAVGEWRFQYAKVD